MRCGRRRAGRHGERAGGRAGGAAASRRGDAGGGEPRSADVPRGLGRSDNLPAAAGAARAAPFFVASPPRFRNANCVSLRSVTLPAAADNSGKIFKVKASGTAAGNVIIATAGSETIDAAATITLESANAAVSLVCDGSNFHIV